MDHLFRLAAQHITQFRIRTRGIVKTGIIDCQLIPVKPMHAMIPTGNIPRIEPSAFRGIAEITKMNILPGNWKAQGEVLHRGVKKGESTGVDGAESDGDRIFHSGAMLQAVGFTLRQSTPTGPAHSARKISKIPHSAGLRLNIRGQQQNSRGKYNVYDYSKTQDTQVINEALLLFPVKRSGLAHGI